MKQDCLVWERNFDFFDPALDLIAATDFVKFAKLYEIDPSVPLDCFVYDNLILRLRQHLSQVYEGGVLMREFP